jgi:hypothetical protein
LAAAEEKRTAEETVGVLTFDLGKPVVTLVDVEARDSMVFIVLGSRGKRIDEPPPPPPKLLLPP